MKTEELTALGLTEEQAKSVIIINGKDIEKYKNLSETQKTELETTKSQLAEANKQIDGFKEMDIETIKKTAEEYKTKFEQSEKDAKAQIESLKYDTALDKYIGTLKIKDDVHANNLKTQIKEKQLQFKEDKLIGGDDIVNSYKEKYPNVFEEEKHSPTFVDSALGNSQSSVNNELRLAMGLAPIKE